MGIKNMLKFLNKNFPNSIQKIDTNNFNKKYIAIDISILLYQVIIAIRNSGADMINNQGDISSHILGLFNKTINLLKLNIIPIYVFDGKPPEFKLKTINNRKEFKQKASEKLNEELTEDEKIKYFKRTVYISKKQIEECMELLDLMGIPYIVAPEEADSQCAELVKSGIADGVLTEDMDIMTFGATKIYRNLTSYNKDKYMILMDDVLNELKLNYDQFIELCLLFGCDYCDLVSNQLKVDDRSKTIYDYYIKYKNIPDTLKDMKKDGFFVYNIDYNIYKNYFLNPPVIKIANSSIKINVCSRDKLEKLLVSKYGLVKMKIQNKMNFLETYTTPI
jgi:flap endonuclease-1